ncbi:hypothetical protein [Paenibacillus sp. PAMC 26794]|uniref:hypothetical protein n=1 Tax=Paenibacillus sp. PAMC 26794 TaxID=1257080 RepID=UPI0003769A9E|nr:hypothetical protein [Paenibacillus sp. PAMC 26794]
METNMTIHIPDVDKYVQELVKKAYEIGVEEGRVKYDYPLVLTKNDLKDIFQVEASAVNKLVENTSFPKFKLIRARYPRDLVFNWISENSSNQTVGFSRRKNNN